MKKRIRLLMVLCTVLLVSSCTTGQVLSVLSGGSGSFQKFKWKNQFNTLNSRDLAYYQKKFNVPKESREYVEAGIKVIKNLQEKADYFIALVAFSEAIKICPENLIALQLYSEASLQLPYSYLDSGIYNAEKLASIAFDVPEVQYLLGRLYLKKRERKYNKLAFFALIEASLLGSSDAWNLGNRVWATGDKERFWGTKVKHPFLNKWHLRSSMI